jgi:hypothetical protein
VKAEKRWSGTKKKEDKHMERRNKAWRSGKKRTNTEQTRYGGVVKEDKQSIEINMVEW